MADDPIRKIDPSDVGESGPLFLLDHSDPTGAPRPDVWRQAVADFYQLDTDASILWSQIGPEPLVVNGDQIFMGTGPDSGEVTDIVIDPSGASDQVIYITTDDGGIWKTPDGGTTWRPLTDQMFSISMGAIAMDPSNPRSSTAAAATSSTAAPRSPGSGHLPLRRWRPHLEHRRRRLLRHHLR
jgi:hypothetical protein